MTVEEYNASLQALVDDFCMLTLAADVHGAFSLGLPEAIADIEQMAKLTDPLGIDVFLKEMEKAAKASPPLTCEAGELLEYECPEGQDAYRSPFHKNVVVEYEMCGAFTVTMEVKNSEEPFEDIFHAVKVDNRWRIDLPRYFLGDMQDIPLEELEKQE